MAVQPGAVFNRSPLEAFGGAWVVGCRTGPQPLHKSVQSIFVATNIKRKACLQASGRALIGGSGIDATDNGDPHTTREQPA
jgi:hypothetical protein